MKEGEIFEIGQLSYEKSLTLQRRLVERRIRDLIPDTLLFLCHEDVLTVGRNAELSNLLIGEDELRRRGIKIFRVERGGDITYHGPGQLMAYPIFKINSGLGGVRRFVRNLEEVIIRTLKEIGIEAKRRDKMVGVFTEKGKIASVGVALRKWVTFHGFALNVKDDMELFKIINPCGLKGVRMTSVEENSNSQIDFEKIMRIVRRKFEEVFGILFREGDKKTLLVESFSEEK